VKRGRLDPDRRTPQIAIPGSELRNPRIKLQSTGLDSGLDQPKSGGIQAIDGEQWVGNGIGGRGALSLIPIVRGKGREKGERRRGGEVEEEEEQG